jgi:hypothetical protein
MILAKSDPIVPAETIRAAFAQVGKPKRRLGVEGDHYSIYGGDGTDEASQAADGWFSAHFAASVPERACGARDSGC